MRHLGAMAQGRTGDRHAEPGLLGPCVGLDHDLHRLYCLVDLDACSVYVCGIDEAGYILLHDNLDPTDEELMIARHTHRLTLMY